MMKRTVVAKSEEHEELIKGGWKPSCAYQSYTHTSTKDGHFVGHNLKPKSELFVVMVK